MISPMSGKSKIKISQSSFDTTGLEDVTISKAAIRKSKTWMILRMVISMSILQKLADHG